MNLDKEFEKEFNELLNGRTEVDSFMKTFSLFSTIDNKIEVTYFIGYNDYDDEDYEVTEEDKFPGYHVSINPNLIDNYQYSLFNIILPSKSEYPVEVEFRTLTRTKKFQFIDFSTLEHFIIDTFNNSSEYTDIIKRIYEVANK